MQLPLATDRDRLRLSPVFWRFAKCHQVCCWNWMFVETGCSKTQSCGLQPVNSPLERKGFRTKLWALYRVEAEAWGHKLPLCEEVRQSQDTLLHRFYLDSGSRLTPRIPSHWGKGPVKAGSSWAPASWSIFGQYLVNIWSARQGSEGFFSVAGMGMALELPGNGESWKWGIVTLRVFYSPRGWLPVPKIKLPCNFSALNPLCFFKVRCNTPAHYTDLSLLLMKLMVKLSSG